ncbi:Transposon TX1 uncharacterized protein [Nymphaea thermarum]|nr:Transposon TX1 uncharacterized protein [Nymphaea thermarum]
MPSIINPFQDAVVLANEVVHSLYCLRLPSFILKLDISKAFDSISWEFLSDLLIRLAFGPSIRQWIMSLVTGAQLAVSFNGKCGDFFSLERGFRQGCPLSPLLFNLVAESFSALFQHATVVGFLAPQSLPHLQTFSTIQYADDFLLFDPATVLLAEACFGCKATSLPMDYLGLQITLSPPAPSFWNEVEQKLTDRLQCWQGKLFSLPGRITVAKHCLASVPLHALVVFRPPVAVLRRFDKLIRKFIWNGDRPSDRLAHWDVVAFPRLLGGAGVTNLNRASESSLCSWWWRLATEHSPITQFISSKFDLPSPSVWNTSISHTSPSHFWCDMLSALPLFLRLADLSSSTSPSWPLSPTREFTFSSCYLASFGPSVASFPPRSLWSPGPSPCAVAFVWLLLTGHINTFDHLQRLGISLANQCPLCLVATESRVHLFTSCPFFSGVLAYVWPSLVSSLPNPPSICLLFFFCPSPHLTASWGHVWRPWLISAWWRIWEERNNRVFRDTFSSPDSVARIVQGDVQFAIRLKRRCPPAASGEHDTKSIAPAFTLEQYHKLLSLVKDQPANINFAEDEQNRSGEGEINETEIGAHSPNVSSGALAVHRSSTSVAGCRPPVVRRRRRRHHRSLKVLGNRGREGEINETKIGAHCPLTKRLLRCPRRPLPSPPLPLAVHRSSFADAVTATDR